MKLDLQVAFRGLSRSDALEADIRTHAEKLERFYDRIMSCRVTVELASGHRQQGKLYSVHIDLKVPGEEIASTRHHENEDAYVATRDAFDAVRRGLEDHASKRRGQTKLHQPL